MKAIKGNKVYRVTKDNKENYKKDGFDIYDDEGKMIDAGVSKTVSYDEYKKLKEELETVKEISINQKNIKEELEKVNKENDNLKTELTLANDKVKELTKTDKTETKK